MKKFLLFVVSSAVLSGGPVCSQINNGLINDTLSIEEVVITGSKTSVNRNIIPLTVSVVSGEKIQGSSESALLPVLSEQVPGLFITERGITGFGVAGGAAGQISMRGIGGSPNTQVLVLVDGNPQFMGIMGHPLPDSYVASDVEKVEVIRGPASTLYGTNAMGGVINILTKEQSEEGFTADSRIVYGSYNTIKYMADAGFRKKRFSVFASFNHDRTAGHRDSSDFSISNGFLKTGYDISKNFRITGNLSLAGFKATDPGSEESHAGNSYDIIRGMGAAVLDNKFENTNGSLRFFHNFGEHEISDGFHSNDINYGIVLYQSINLFRGNSLTIGFDHKKYGGFAENVKAMAGEGIVLGDTTVSETAIYAYVQQDLPEKITLNAGFRLDHNSVSGFEPVPTAGISYRPSDVTTLKASMAKGFRNPAIRELFLFAPANNDLKPEKMMNYEISISQRLLENKISVELTLFNAAGDNLIQTIMSESGPMNQNSGTFSNTGIEFSGTFRPVKNLAINSTYSYTHMKKPVLASPEQLMNLGATWKLNRVHLNLSFQHVHGLYTRLSPYIASESYSTVNTRVSYTINSYLNVFLKGENLTNSKYQINYGYPMPGIIVFGGINLHINKAG